MWPTPGYEHPPPSQMAPGPLHAEQADRVRGKAAGAIDASPIPGVSREHADTWKAHMALVLDGTCEQVEQVGPISMGRQRHSFSCMPTWTDACGPRPTAPVLLNRNQPTWTAVLQSGRHKGAAASNEYACA